MSFTRLLFVFLAASSVLCYAQSDDFQRYNANYFTSKYSIQLSLLITRSSNQTDDIYQMEMISCYREKSDEQGAYKCKTAIYFIKHVGDQFYVSKDARVVPTQKPVGYTAGNEGLVLTDFRILEFKPEEGSELYLAREGFIQIDGAEDEEMVPPPPPPLIKNDN